MPTFLLDLTPLTTPTRTHGIGRYLINLARGLSRLPTAELGGLRLRALTALDWSGRTVITDDLAAAAEPPQAQLPSQSKHYGWAYRRRLALWRGLRHAGADWVHLGATSATPLGKPFARARFLVTCHDLIPYKFPEHYLGWADGGPILGRRIVRRRVRSADHLLAISEATRRDLIELLGVPAERISRAYNGSAALAAPESTPLLEPLLERHALQRGHYLLYFGDTDWRKNVDGMVGGLAEARKLGVNVRLAIAGNMKAARAAAVVECARRFGLENEVVLLGYVSDGELRALLGGALAHILVSRDEGFGLTVIEAMAADCPVITTRSGSLAEVAGDAALLVEPEEHAAIGAAIATLARSPELAASLVARGAERARTFTLERQARETLAIYRKLTES